MRYPRTNHTIPTPAAIAMSPPVLKALSGILITSSASLFASEGMPP